MLKKLLTGIALIAVTGGCSPSMRSIDSRNLSVSGIPLNKKSINGYTFYIGAKKLPNGKLAVVSCAPYHPLLGKYETENQSDEMAQDFLQKNTNYWPGISVGDDTHIRNPSYTEIFKGREEVKINGEESTCSTFKY